MPTGNTQQIIDYGAAANDGTGDPLRTAFIKTDENFDNIWLAGPVGSNIRITNNSISALDTNGNIAIVPNGVGIIQANASIVPSATTTKDLGTSIKKWRRVYSANVFADALSVSADAVISGNLTVQGNVIHLGNITTDSLTIQLANTAANSGQANGAGVTVGANDDIATWLYDDSANVWESNIGIKAPYVEVPALAAPNIYVNSISSDDSSFVTVNDGLDVNGDVTAEYFIGDGSYLTNLGFDQSSPGNTYTINLTDGTIFATVSDGTINTSSSMILIGQNYVGYGEFLNENFMHLLENGADIVSPAAPITGQLWWDKSTASLQIWDGLQWQLLGPHSVSNGNSNVGIAAANGNVTVITAGTNIWNFDINGSLTAPGNISGTYILGNASQVTGLAAVAYSGNYADLSGTPVIPTATSNLINDSGFITSSAIPTNVSAFTNDAGYITTAKANVISVNGQTGVVSLTIPTATSNLTNDSGFITSTTANVISVNGQTGVVSLSIPTATSNLTNDSGYITTGNLASLSTNVSTTGNISGSYILGNGSQLTGLPAQYGNANVSAFLASYGSNTISTTGNITGGYFIGNGSQLTGLPASYTNSNVVSLLASFGSNTISTTGNITAGNFIGNISLTGNVQGTSANVTLVAGSYSTVFDNTGTATFPGNIVGNTAGFAIGYRDIPQVSFTGDATLAATDAGKHYYSTLATANTLIIANNGSVSWPVGTAITVVNRGAGNITVAQGSGVSLYLAGNSTAGNRTVTTYGMATLLNVAANVWMINGTGVS